MEDSMIISIGAIFIAVISLLLHLMKHLESRPNLEIKTNEHNCYFFKVRKGDDKYQYPFRLCIHVTVINKSSKPISIHEFSFMSSETELIRSAPFHRPSEKYLIYSDSHQETTLPLSSVHLKPVIGLAPYESIDGAVFFVTVPDLETQLLSGELTIKTSRKVFVIPVTCYRSDTTTKQRLFQQHQDQVQQNLE